MIRWASLDESVLYLNEVKEGTAVGYLSSDVSGSGDTVTIYLSALVNNGNGKEQIATNNTVMWLSPASWSTAGNISAVSVFRLIDLVDWNAMGMFEYSEDSYSVMVSDYSQSGNQIFLTEGNGRFGGSWNYW